MPIDDATQRQTPEETPTLLVASEPSTRARNLFTPGTLILNRYRIINHLGSGGMGDVYRADDLKLAQTVALKFIPRHLVAEPGVLAMLLSEVRIGREVSHPNVCRLYDVVEFEGHHFIAMQFVDGEDLASLLRRIGRLPVEKAIDIARDIAAGLAAAHELGVIHRDLKPANIMIDGRGRAHITDFGLAIVSGDSQRRGLAGTPIYMAPEQLSADEVTTATDVYAVGLILWEMLSGKRLYEPGTITQIAEAHNSAKSSLAAAVRDVPLKIDSLVMQCLDEDPLRRPRSARELLASLPGGDPLAAAMAAGDTPSPELVAAASMKGTVSLSVALMGLALFVAMMIAVALLTPHATLVSRERFRKPPEALIDRADEIVKASGIAADPADRAAAFFDLRRKQTEALDRDRVSFLYRRAATPLTTRTFNMQVTEDNPPFNAPGMANVVMSGDGRLLSFVAVPRVDAKPAPHAIDAMFLAAGYDRAEFRPVTPRFPPPVGADERLAWDGKVHVEAALYRGAPVWFAIDPRASVPQQMGLFGTGGVIWNLLYAVLVSLSCIFAWINVRRGSGDRRGAIRVAVALAIARIIEGVISMHLAGASFSEAATSIGGLGLFAAVGLHGARPRAAAADGEDGEHRRGVAQGQPVTPRRYGGASSASMDCPCIVRTNDVFAPFSSRRRTR